MADDRTSEAEYDVIIIGSGVAGALAAYKLAGDGHKVLILEAGGEVPGSLTTGKPGGRDSLVSNFIHSHSKGADSPYCGEGIRAPQPDLVESGKNYYDYDPQYGGDLLRSYYERLVGGSTWHWQGLFLRMLPSDFEIKKRYRVGLDWPLTYDDLEPWYVLAEEELGVSGSDSEFDEYHSRVFKAYRSKKFPMSELKPSYVDKQISRALGRHTFLDGKLINLTTTPHATNSVYYKDRPPCTGNSSCVPLCPSGARYDATVHVKLAIQRGAELRTRSVVSKLETDRSKKRIVKVWYLPWTWDRSGQYLPQEPKWVSGRVIALAANGIENPMILLRSNVANSSDAVGRHLMDHPIKQSFALAVEPVYPYRGPTCTSGIEVFRDGKFRSKFAAFKTEVRNDGWRWSGTGSPTGWNLLPKGTTDVNPGTVIDLVQNWGYVGGKLRRTIESHATRQVALNSACEQLPYWENRVLLSNNTDVFGLQRPMIKYRVDNDDGYVAKSFAKSIELHDAVFEAMQIPKNSRFLQDDGTKTYGGSGHIMGTTIMGTNPDRSVVNSDCRTHDVANLYVLGSSVFTTGSTANSTATIAALALRTARLIHEALNRRV